MAFVREPELISPWVIIRHSSMRLCGSVVLRKAAFTVEAASRDVGELRTLALQ